MPFVLIQGFPGIQNKADIKVSDWNLKFRFHDDTIQQSAETGIAFRVK